MKVNRLLITCYKSIKRRWVIGQTHACLSTGWFLIDICSRNTITVDECCKSKRTLKHITRCFREKETRMYMNWLSMIQDKRKYCLYDSNMYDTQCRHYFSCLKLLYFLAQVSCNGTPWSLRWKKFVYSIVQTAINFFIERAHAILISLFEVIQLPG